MKDTVLIKLSGNVVADARSLGKLVSYIHDLKKQDKQVILVHGGGKQINELCKRMEVEVHQVAGRRVTGTEALEMLLYTVGGRTNRELVAFLRDNDISSVGISGVDGGLTTSHRRPPLEIDGKPVDFGLVGEIDSVDTTLLKLLVKAGHVPVIGCLTWSAGDGILNINADTFAIRISVAMKSDELIMLMDPPAVLNAEQKPIAILRRSDWQRGLQEGWVRDGMKPKLLTAFEALGKGVHSVRLTNADTLASGGGTIIAEDDQ